MVSPSKLGFQDYGFQDLKVSDLILSFDAYDRKCLNIFVVSYIQGSGFTSMKMDDDG